MGLRECFLGHKFWLQRTQNGYWRCKHLLRNAWGGWQKRSLEQFEFIDIREPDALVSSWEGFVHSGQHHYDFHKDFFTSWIVRHPRRSHQAYWEQYMEAQFIDDNFPPRGRTLSELWDWYETLVKHKSA